MDIIANLNRIAFSYGTLHVFVKRTNEVEKQEQKNCSMIGSWRNSATHIFFLHNHPPLFFRYSERIRWIGFDLYCAGFRL